MSAQTAIERIQRALSIAETTSAENPHTDVGLAAAHNQGILFFLMDEVRESIREHQADHYSGLVAELEAGFIPRETPE
jgi:LPS O-antigen subunit length determinant protein (WzzB/FepE family)